MSFRGAHRREGGRLGSPPTDTPTGFFFPLVRTPSHTPHINVTKYSTPVAMHPVGNTRMPTQSFRFLSSSLPSFLPLSGSLAHVILKSLEHSKCINASLCSARHFWFICPEPVGRALTGTREAPNYRTRWGCMYHDESVFPIGNIRFSSLAVRIAMRFVHESFARKKKRRAPTRSNKHRDDGPGVFERAGNLGTARIQRNAHRYSGTPRKNFEMISSTNKLLLKNL